MLDFVILVLRVSVGIVMIGHGVHKFEKLSYLNKKWHEEYGFPVGSAALAGVIQIAGGLAMLVGVFTSYAAVINALVMLVATYACLWKEHEPFLSTPAGKGWDVNLSVIASLVALILLGDGGYSLVGLVK